MSKSLVGFYDDHNCIPVNQQGTSQDRSLVRDYLYNSIGLNSLALNNLDVCEIGPGTGQNALDLSQRGLNSLLLIEPSQAGQLACSKLLNEGLFHCPVSIFEGTTEDINNDNSFSDSFDLVISEGLVGSSGYDNPLELFDSIAKLVRHQGYFMVGCEDDTGWFPEMLRRFISLVLCKQNYEVIFDNLDACVHLLKPFLINSHSTLNFKTIRMTSDIIIDNILSPVLDKPFLGPLDILKSRPSFRYISSSPNYSIVPTYYKEAATHAFLASEDFQRDYIRKSLYVFDRIIKEDSLLSFVDGQTFVDELSIASIQLKEISSLLLCNQTPDVSTLLSNFSIQLKKLIAILSSFSYHRISLLSHIHDLVECLATDLYSAKSSRLVKNLLSSESLSSWYGRTQTTLLLQNLFY